mmetsp:Transcript_30/g.82  ORF Transcript_30/g.82 Transcript_30/m.82 type:complete len:129 (-) Transcript_30:8-394(-)
MRGVVGGAGGTHSNSRRPGKYFDMVDGEATAFSVSATPNISIIFGVLVSKDNCLMSSRARSEDIISEPGRKRPSPKLGDALQSIIVIVSSLRSEWIFPLQITEDVRRCVFDEDKDISLLDGNRGLVIL